MMIHNETTPKNKPNILVVMTFFKSMASGSERPTTAIENAIAVPKGTPLWTITCMMGNIPAVLVYIGTPNMTAKGTANRLSLLIYCSKKLVGIYPCMTPPMATPMII